MLWPLLSVKARVKFNLPLFLKCFKSPHRRHYFHCNGVHVVQLLLLLMVGLLFVCSLACLSFSCAGSPSLVYCTESCFRPVPFVLPVLLYALSLTVQLCFCLFSFLLLCVCLMFIFVLGFGRV